MFIRTDRSIFGEAFIHKAAGIAILALALRFFRFRWSDIGFRKRAALRHILWGLALGLGAFVIAYGAELAIQRMSGSSPALAVYITSYALGGNNVMETSAVFFAICIVGNIINVVMEEGVFRGLFVKLGEQRYSFFASLLISSLLFGVWHIAAPLREWLDGNMQLSSALISAGMQIFLTGLGGVMFCLLVKISGSLWVAMAAHFVNNFVVNILHVVTATGADEMQVIRISVAQTISFIIVLSVFLVKKSYRQVTFRAD